LDFCSSFLPLGSNAAVAGCWLLSGWLKIAEEAVVAAGGGLAAVLRWGSCGGLLAREGEQRPVEGRGRLVLGHEAGSSSREREADGSAVAR